MASEANQGRGATRSYELAATDIAACAGWSGERRRGWTEGPEPLLRPRGPFTAHDAVETAIAARLAESTNKNAAPAAWARVRSTVRELTVAGKDDIWIVASEPGRKDPGGRTRIEAVAVAGAAASAKAAARLGVPVWIVPTRDAIRRAKGRFEALVPDKPAQATVTPMRAGRADGA